MSYNQKLKSEKCERLRFLKKWGSQKRKNTIYEFSFLTKTHANAYMYKMKIKSKILFLSISCIFSHSVAIKASFILDN